MRQSIVLLITLFFITAISILILQNLKDTDEFLNKVSYDSALSQTIISMDNIKQEIPKYLQKYKGNIDEILKNSQAIPLQFGNVDILLNIQEYELPQFNINELNSSMKSNEDFVNNINYKYDFLQLVNKNKPYSSNNQIEQTINEYIKSTKDKEILNIKDKFTFLSDKNSSKLIKCEYILNIDTVTSNVSFLFDLNSSVIKDFYLEKIRYNQE